MVKHRLVVPQHLGGRDLQVNLRGLAITDFEPDTFGDMTTSRRRRLRPEQEVVYFQCGVSILDADLTIMGGSNRTTWPVVLLCAVAVEGFAQQPAARLDQAERLYAQAIALQQAGHPGCVDAFYAAGAECWSAMLQSAAMASQQPLNPQIWTIYHDSVAGLIEQGQRHGRLDPRSHLTVHTASGTLAIPIRFIGFSWRPEDFHQLAVVRDYRPQRPRTVHRRAGLGVPMVVMRYQTNPGDFLRERHPFAATAVLQPFDGSDSNMAASLDFYDSLTVRRISLAGAAIDLAGDITAPLVVGLEESPRPRLSDLFLPGSSTNRSELYFLEPHRPGRIPLVFIHGLLSEPSTWVEVANELRAIPEVTDRYQIWAFRYPSVEPFLEPAAALREQLQQAVITIDPSATDPALRNIVLVGHSMGGLIAKLQVTHSGTTLWSAFANRPLETIVADDATKARLHRNFFFVPSPLVRRVVFVGSPHAGSSLASQSVGRLASSCVERSPESTQAHRLLLQYNPNTFSPVVANGFPNSVDLLQPTSPLLAAMRQLPVNPNVRLHSVIGRGYPMLSAGDSDGIVPVSSARHPGVQTETLVRAWHTRVHDHPETLRALLFILELHYAEFLASLGQ